LPSNSLVFVMVDVQGQKLAAYCYDLVVNNVDDLSRTHRDEVNSLLLYLQQCNVPVVNIGARLSDDDKTAMLQVSCQLYS